MKYLVKHRNKLPFLWILIVFLIALLTDASSIAWWMVFVEFVAQLVIGIGGTYIITWYFSKYD